MAKIEKRQCKDGSFSWRVGLRKNGIDISKTFYSEEDAKLYAFYKERLLDNIKAFDVSLKDRVTLKQIFEMKIESIVNIDKKELNSFKNACERFCEVFKDKFFLCEITLDDWKRAAKSIYEKDVFRGSKTEKNKRKMSPTTLKRIFAYASSSITHAQSKGIDLENHALKVIQQIINPMIGPF